MPRPAYQETRQKTQLKCKGFARHARRLFDFVWQSLKPGRERGRGWGWARGYMWRTNKYVQSNRFPVSSSQQFAFKPEHKSTSKDIPENTGRGKVGGKKFFFEPRHFIERIIDCSDCWQRIKGFDFGQL